MDVRVFKIVVLVLVGAILAVLLQPLLDLQVPAGFWTVLGAVITYLGASSVLDKKDPPDE